jgi:hypothetical protein
MASNSKALLMTKHVFIASFLIASVFAVTGTATGQIKISGQTCVLPGTIYQYVISGSIDSSSPQLCVTAGSVLDSATGWIPCKTSAFSSNALLVVWNDSAADEGVLTLTTSAGNASLSTHFAPALQPGAMDSISKTQIISIHQVPSTISCGPDSGGSCSPSYSHLWQQSVDMVSWSDILSATGLSISSDTALTQTTYFRRKVIENSSGSIGYSDVAAVFVMIDSTDSSSGFSPLRKPAINPVWTMPEYVLAPDVLPHFPAIGPVRGDTRRKSNLNTIKG